MPEPTYCFLDTETFSTKPINVGTYAYAEAATVELLSYKRSDEDVAHIYEPDIEDMPADFRESLEDPSVILVAHNVPFDRTVMRIAMGIDIPIERWRCSMACARSLGLPGALDKLGVIVGLDEDKLKLKEGKALVQKFCKPAPKKSKVYRYDRYNSPEDWARYKEYNLQDTYSLEALWWKLPKWNYSGEELESWFEDQRINDHGIAIDLSFVGRAITATGKAKTTLDSRMVESTAGIIASVSKRDALLEYLQEVLNFDIADLKGSTIESILDGVDVPEEVRDLLYLRLKGTKTSTAKYKKIQQAVSADGKLRGTITWCGAARTGRDAGKTVQPQNFPRPKYKQAMIEMGFEASEFEIEDVLFGDDVLEFYASALRGVFIAPPGRKMPVADLANIEGRVLAWQAGEKWKLQAFTDYDTVQSPDGSWLAPEAVRLHTLYHRAPPPMLLDKKGEPIRKGHDLYKLAYAKSFNVDPEEVVGDKRQVGKVEELALGYAGGVNAFVTFATAYTIDLDDMAQRAWAGIPLDVLEKARGAWEWAGEQKRRNGLSEAAYIACDSIKRMWRAGHPATVQYWYDVDKAFRMALACPGETFSAGPVQFRFVAPWLAVRLPSGRLLTYYQPKEADDGQLSYMGIDQFTKRWKRVKTYHGKLCIAEGTLVLAQRGWIPIESVTLDDLLWDGDAWVRHDGLVFKGFSEVIYAHGVAMTPDHEVLTEKGWVRASQSEGYNRATCRVPDGYAVRGVGRTALVMGSDLRLRRDEGHGPQRPVETAGTRDSSVMRVQETGDHRPPQHNARYEQTPCLRGVAQHGGPLHTAITSRVAQLWRAWHNGVQALGNLVREVLGGHGPYLRVGAASGPQEQQPRVQQGKLPLGDGRRERQQQTGEPYRTDAGRSADGGAVVSQDGHRPDHAAVPLVAGGPMAGTGHAPRQFAYVFDIVNAGPQRRFVTLSEDGRPLIVHNCENFTQAIARDVLFASQKPARDAGYMVNLKVHDELITDAPDLPEYNADHLSAIMSTVPRWAAGLPLAAAGFDTYRYRKG